MAHSEYCIVYPITRFFLFLLTILNQIQYWSMLTSWNHTYTLWKKNCFATSVATQFWFASDNCNLILNCIGQLQLIVFIRCECYWTNCKSCNSPYIHCNSLQLNYNFVATTLFQLLCNSPMITIIMSWWHHFSSIHQNLTCGTMKIFRDFFEILISIIHYDYSF